MTNVDGITTLALLLKEGQGGTTQSITTGLVEKTYPDFAIRLNEVVVLTNDQLVFAGSLLPTHRREMVIRSPKMVKGDTDKVNDGGQGASSHGHVLKTFEIETPVEFTDTLKIGDEVIMIPSGDGQTFYVIDKAVRP